MHCTTGYFLYSIMYHWMISLNSDITHWLILNIHMLPNNFNIDFIPDMSNHFVFCYAQLSNVALSLAAFNIMRLYFNS